MSDHPVAPMAPGVAEDLLKHMTRAGELLPNARTVEDINAVIDLLEAMREVLALNGCHDASSKLPSALVPGDWIRMGAAGNRQVAIGTFNDGDGDTVVVPIGTNGSIEKLLFLDPRIPVPVLEAV